MRITASVITRSARVPGPGLEPILSVASSADSSGDEASNKLREAEFRWSCRLLKAVQKKRFVRSLKGIRDLCLRHTTQR